VTRLRKRSYSATATAALESAERNGAVPAPEKTKNGTCSERAAAERAAGASRGRAQVGVAGAGRRLPMRVPLQTSSGSYIVRGPTVG
jgi:hypothetical protein